MGDVIYDVRQVRVKDLDADAPNSIVEVDAKLKELLAMIDEKLRDPLSYKGDDLRGYLGALKDLEHELFFALTGLLDLVKFMGDKELDFKELLYNSEDLEEFHEYVLETLNKIGTLDSK